MTATVLEEEADGKAGTWEVGSILLSLFLTHCVLYFHCLVFYVGLEKALGRGSAPPPPSKAMPWVLVAVRGCIWVGGLGWNCLCGGGCEFIETQLPLPPD